MNETSQASAPVTAIAHTSATLKPRHDLSAICSRDETREVLNYAHIDVASQQLIATDGRILCRLPIDATGHNQLIHRDLLKAACKPGKRGDLKTATSTKESIEIETIGRDLESVKQTLSQKVSSRENYPAWRQVIPEQVKPLTITLNANYMKKIAEYAIKHGDKETTRIVVSLTDNTSPACFEVPMAYSSQESSASAHFVLMPIRAQA